MSHQERFEIAESEGRDELGEVFRGKAKASAERVAVKVFDAPVLARETGRDAYARALEALRTIGPARTPQVVDFALSSSDGWLATRWVEGRHLNEAAGGAVPFEQAAAWICGVLDALDELHSTGFAHGGLTPRKVLLVGDAGAGSVVVTDPFQHFLYSVDDPVKSARTEPERFVGLPQYFSPEQAQGRTADVRSDIYTVGLILYELVTGKSPFASSAAGTTLKRQIHEKPLPPRLAKPGLKLSREAESVINRALAKDPAERFAAAREFRRALGELRTDCDELTERLAAPLGVTPRGVLAGEDVAPEAPTVATVHGTAEIGGSPAATLEAPQPSIVVADVANEPATQTIMLGTGAIQAAAEAARAADEARAAATAAAASATNEPEPVSPAAAEPVAPASIEPVAQAPVAEVAPAPVAAAAPVEARAPVVEERDKWGKKKKGKSKTGAVASVASPPSSATGTSPVAAPASASAAPEAAKEAAVVAPEAAAARSAEPARTAGQKDEHAEWFSEGENQEVIADRQTEELAAIAFDPARQRKTFTVAMVAGIAVTAVVAIVVLSMGSRRADPAAAEIDEEPVAAEVDAGAPPPARNTAPDVTPTAPADVAAATADAPVVADVAPADGSGVAMALATTPPAAVPTAVPTTPPPAIPSAMATAAPPPAIPTAAPTTPPPAAPTTVAVVTPTPTPTPAPTPTPEPEPEPEVDNEAQVRSLVADGRSALGSRDYGTAERAFRDALALDDSSSAAYAGLGEIYFQQSDFTEAVRNYRRATQLSSRNEDYQRKLGMSYYRLGQLQPALTAFERAVELGDDSAQTLVDRVRGELGQ